ncbi:MAG: hypothetical protein ACRC4N_10205, partial [Gammaproteobacteria bacterium]
DDRELSGKPKVRGSKGMNNGKCLALDGYKEVKAELEMIKRRYEKGEYVEQDSEGESDSNFELAGRSALEADKKVRKASRERIENDDSLCNTQRGGLVVKVLGWYQKDPGSIPTNSKPQLWAPEQGP